MAAQPSLCERAVDLPAPSNGSDRNHTTRHGLAVVGGPALRWRTQRRFPYLFKEIAGVHDFDDRFVYVTDGGQMDNLGLLALLVRRCRLIIAVDASGDGAGTTNTFLQLVQVAYHRYGIRFSVDEASEPLPADPVPGREPPPLTTLTAKMCSKVEEVGADDPKLAAAGRLFEAATARLLIHYPHVSDDMPATKGRLILAKAILTNGLEDELYAFARDDKAGKQFPKDSTADQFLTPVQFDAYRRLGHAIGAVASGEAEIDLRS